MLYLALLRGINVGGNNKIDMKELKAGFESLGYKKVQTYINTGNIIFDSPEIKKQDLVEAIQKMIETKFNLKIPVVICTYENLLKVMETIPDEYVNDKGMKSDVMFLWEEVDQPEVLEKLEIKQGVDRVHYVSGAVVWSLDRENYNKSGMHKIIGTKLYSKMTVRNVNTVRKLVGLMGES